MTTLVKTTLGCALVAVAMLSGCSQGAPAKSSPPAAVSGGEALPAGLFAAARPAGEQRIPDASKTAKAGDVVVLRGVVRGIKSSFTPGRAVMKIADESVPLCHMYPDRRWDLHCETPESMLLNTATIQIVGSDGKPLKAGLQGVNGIDHLVTVVVQGKVAEAGEKTGLVINAEQIYVERKG